MNMHVLVHRYQWNLNENYYVVKRPLTWTSCKKKCEIYLLSAFDMNKFYLHRYLKISCEFVLGEFNLLT